MIIILGIRLYRTDIVVQWHHSFSVLNYLLMLPTCLTLADISKWIGIRISCYFLEFIVCVDVHDGDISDAKFIDVLFDGRAGLYLSPSSAVFDAV